MDFPNICMAPDSETQLQTFHLQKVHDFLPADYSRRQQFCHWLPQQHTIDRMFIRRVQFTDVALFTRGSIINPHNMYMWVYENPHRTTLRGYQRRFSVKVWCGIVDNHVLGPHVLPPRLTCPVYRQFVEHELPGLLHEDAPLATRNSMWFMHDGAPAHFSHVAREYLHVAYPNRWMSRAGRVA